MVKKHGKRKDAAKELEELERKVKKWRHELKEAQRELHLCLKKCMKKIDDPPWHYGPRCSH